MSGGLLYTQKAVSPSESAQKKKKNHYIFSSQLRADQMPGPPRKGQLMWTFFLNTHQ